MIVKKAYRPFRQKGWWESGKVCLWASVLNSCAITLRDGAFNFAKNYVLFLTKHAVLYAIRKIYYQPNHQPASSHQLSLAIQPNDKGSTNQSTENGNEWN